MTVYDPCCNVGRLIKVCFLILIVLLAIDHALQVRDAFKDICVRVVLNVMNNGGIVFKIVRHVSLNGN